MNNCIRTALVALSCMAFPAWAVSPSPASSDNNVSTSPEPSSVLPFFGDSARAEGYDLPEPFGVNINYMNMRQNIDVNNIGFSGLALGPIPLDNAFKINAGKTRESSKTETLKLDAWLFPFMNVYGLVGHTEGHSLSHIGVGINLPGGGTIHPQGLQDLDFQLDFKGTTYGVGTTFVAGIGNWFGSLDANYTQTRFDILDGSIDAFTLSPRVGYRFTTPALNKLYLPQGQLNVWVGSMFQDVQQEFRGSLNDLHMPSELMSQMLGLANQKGNGRFDVKQRLKSPWNMLIGAQYDFTRNLNLTTEFGFAERNSFLASVEYRF
ncbi:Uncharacterised protein [Cedecea lapagei]|uniref:Lipoprotein n=2 Tax=Cedecea lapagei TaxID=158823 RepID=A0A447UW67_9ENTR|nr:Uncharacterised protein [Cedecea lapagei]